MNSVKLWRTEQDFNLRLDGLQPSAFEHFAIGPWCGVGDSNPYGFPVDCKSTATADFANPAQNKTASISEAALEFLVSVKSYIPRSRNGEPRSLSDERQYKLELDSKVFTKTMLSRVQNLVKL